MPPAPPSPAEPAEPAEVAVRDERDGDAPGVFAVHAAAFPALDEARLVDALRDTPAWLASVVAEREGEVVGHALFTRATVRGDGGREVAALAPMAVLPPLQRRGIGDRLVRAGLERCRTAGLDAAVVLGHPSYYPRFGFEPAARHGVTWRPALDDALFVLALAPGALHGLAGRVEYAPEIERLG